MWSIMTSYTYDAWGHLVLEEARNSENAVTSSDQHSYECT